MSLSWTFYKVSGKSCLNSLYLSLFINLKCQKVYAYVLTITFILMMSLSNTLGPLLLDTGLPPRDNTKLASSSVCARPILFPADI